MATTPQPTPQRSKADIIIEELQWLRTKLTELESQQKMMGSMTPQELEDLKVELRSTRTEITANQNELNNYLRLNRSQLNNPETMRGGSPTITPQVLNPSEQPNLETPETLPTLVQNENADDHSVQRTETPQPTHRRQFKLL